MPEDDAQTEQRATANSSTAAPAQARSRDWRDVFTLPAPVKRVFEKFPLVTYPANEHPLRAPRQQEQHTLYIFTTEDDAEQKAPSFNPTCLKWQVSRTNTPPPSDCRRSHALHSGLLAVMRYKFPYGRFKQPCLTKRSSSFPST